MNKTDADREGRVKDDSLRVLNICFLVAAVLATIIVVYAYTLTVQSAFPSEVQTGSALDGLKVQGQTLYEGISSTMNDFVEWGMNLINSFKV